MARQLGGINGPFIGKVGTVIGYSRDGEYFIKGVNKRRRKKPAVGMEAFNQKKFATAQIWLKPLVNTLRVGFKGYKKSNHGFQAAKSYLMNHALSVVGDNIIIDPALMKVSVGNLPLPENIRCEVLDHASMKISWDPSLSNWSDQVNIVAYNIDARVRDRHNNLAVRQYLYEAEQKVGEQIISPLPAFDTPWHVWVWFITADRLQRSESVYLGSYQLIREFDNELMG